MKKNGRWVLLFMLALVLSVSHSMSVGGVDQVMVIIDAAKGFAGTLEGKVISRNDTGTQFVIKVEKVKTLAKYNQWNTARKPSALKGQKVLIYTKWIQAQNSKTYVPDETHALFVNGLKIGSKTSIDVYSDRWNRLILVEVPKDANKMRAMAR